MAENNPFRINRSALPTEDARKMFNTANCFAKGKLTMGADNKPRLAGNCQVVQFGKNHTGNDCMFVCQTDFTKGERPVLASFVFDHMGRVFDLYYGNSAATPEWKTHVDDGTRASFGYLPPPSLESFLNTFWLLQIDSQIKKINQDLKQHHSSMTDAEKRELHGKKKTLQVKLDRERDEAKAKHAELLQTPRWGCTRVLKGPLDFIGCQRKDRWTPFTSLVEGFPFVSCVEVNAEFDHQLDMSQALKIKPHFKHDPLYGKSEYGASGYEYYDGGFGNVCGIPGFQSFVVLQPDGTTSTMETRTDQRDNPMPIPRRLSVSNPDTRHKFEVALREGHESVLSEMPALEWVETHPLVFPGAGAGPIDETFAARAFEWVHDFSTKFTPRPHKLTMSKQDLLKKVQSRVASMQDVSVLAPTMGKNIFEGLVTQPRGSKQIATKCKCTPTNHDPKCINQFCLSNLTRVERPSFEWPRRPIVSGPRELVVLLAAQIVESQNVERIKKLAADEADAKRIEAAAKQAADAAKKAADADAKREEKNAAAREATALRKAAKASGVPAASLRGRRATAALVAPLASVEPVASSVAPSVVASSVVASSEAHAPAAQKRKTSASSASASASASAPPSETRKKRKGGSKSKSKSKSKRRVRK